MQKTRDACRTEKIISYPQIGGVFLVLLFCSCSTPFQPRRTEVNTSAVWAALAPGSFDTRAYRSQEGKDLRKKYHHSRAGLKKEGIRSAVGDVPFAPSAVSVGMELFNPHIAPSSDERSLQVILEMPDIVGEKINLREQIRELLGHYNFDELISTLAADPQLLNLRIRLSLPLSVPRIGSRRLQMGGNLRIRLKLPSSLSATYSF